MRTLLKQFIFTALLAPLISYAMEYQPDRIELGKQLVKAAANLDWKKVKILINQKADLNQTDNNGWTTLMYATSKNQAVVVKILIDAHADLNHKNNNGWTALMSAAFREYREIAQMLIDAGADLNQKNNNNDTAFVLATSFKKPPNYHLFFQAHLNLIAKQKEWVNTTSLCFKRLFGTQYPHVRNIFKPILKAMIQEVRQAMLDDINQSRGDGIEQELLALCNSQQRQDRNS